MAKCIFLFYWQFHCEFSSVNIVSDFRRHKSFHHLLSLVRIFYKFIVQGIIPKQKDGIPVLL